MNRDYTQTCQGKVMKKVIGSYNSGSVLIVREDGNWDYFEWFVMMFSGKTADAEQYSAKGLACICHSFQCLDEKKVVFDRPWIYDSRISTIML